MKERKFVLSVSVDGKIHEKTVMAKSKYDAFEMAKSWGHSLSNGGEKFLGRFTARELTDAAKYENFIIDDDIVSPTETRSALKLLMIDETEAVEGYDKVLAMPLSEKARRELELLRNEEIAHIKKLSELYVDVVTGAIDEHLAEELKDALTNEQLLKLKLRLNDLNNEIWGLEDRIDRDSPYKNVDSLYEQLKKLEAERDKVRREFEAVSGITDAIDDTNYVYETDKPNVKWRMHKAKNGSYYFKAPDGTTYKENNNDVIFWSKTDAGKFFIIKLFNKSLWGFEVPKVIIDSESGKRFWVTFGDWGGSRRVVEFDNPVDRKYAENVMKELKVFQENTVGFETKEEADAKIEKLKKGDPNYADEETKYIKFMVVVSDAQAPGNVIKCNGGWCVTADKNWWLLYSPNGFFKYSSTTPESRTVFKTEAEANMVAKEFLRSEFGVKDSESSKFNSLVKELEGVRSSGELEILRASIWSAMYKGQLSVGEAEEISKKCIEHCLKHNLK